MKKRKRLKYSFAKREDTEGGKSSVLFAGFSLVIFLAAVIMSFFMGGNAASWIGALGLMAVLFSVTGFFIGIKSFQEKEKNYRLSVLGAMANGIGCIGWLALLLIGV